LRLTTKESNRLFEGSFLSGDPYLQDFILKLDTDCDVERSVYNIVVRLGLSFDNYGTKYILHSIVKTVCDMKCPENIKYFYLIAAERFSKSTRSVEVAITRTIANISTSKLKDVNVILGCEVFNSSVITAGEFMSKLCTALIMCRCHEKGETYFR